MHNFKIIYANFKKGRRACQNIYSIVHLFIRVKIINDSNILKYFQQDLNITNSHVIKYNIEMMTNAIVVSASKFGLQCVFSHATFIMLSEGTFIDEVMKRSPL